MGWSWQSEKLTISWWKNKKLTYIRVTWISDRQNWDAEEFTASSAQIDVVAVVFVNTSFAQHSIVFNLAAAKTIKMSKIRA